MNCQDRSPDKDPVSAGLLRPVSPNAAVGRLRVASLYCPFFKAGILVGLTLGASWGVYLLLRIVLSHSLTAVSLHEVNAHGHAQIFGWVGLFVMGFGYEAFPRLKRTPLPKSSLAPASAATDRSWQDVS